MRIRAWSSYVCSSDLVPLQYAFIHGELEDCVPFLEATGFTKICHDLRIGWDGSDYGYKPVDGVRCELYRGGDPVMNERVAAFQNRAFVREPMVAQIGRASCRDRGWQYV